jgi:hypothetical protein
MRTIIAGLPFAGERRAETFQKDQYVRNRESDHRRRVHRRAPRRRRNRPLSSEKHHVASILRQAGHGTSGDRPVQRLHLGGWQGLGPFLTATRKAGLRVFYSPHRRYHPGDYETWKYVAPIQRDAWSHKTFKYGTWGGEFRSEFAPQPGEMWPLSIGVQAASPTRIWTFS